LKFLAYTVANNEHIFAYYK